jgi:UDP-N-acetylglucosamine acyltransferase
MNKISKLSKLCSSLTIGKNNMIGDNVKIMENVIIGNNNKIYDNTIIYPNTTIGNNNVILNNNIIGEHSIEAKYDFTDKVFNGLQIGNNNFLHISNKIFNGFHKNTVIGNNNKILGEVHLGHDVKIKNNVHIYPRALLSGFVEMNDYSGAGVSCVIHQRKKIGNYAFLGMNNTITKDVFPFYININNKYHKFNYNRIDIINFNDNEIVINEIRDKYINNDININNYKLALDKNIFDIIKNFIS